MILARKKLGLSQSALAKVVQLSQSAVADYETGGVEPSERNFAKIAAGLDVSFDWLCGLDDKIGDEHIGDTVVRSLNITSKLRPSWTDKGAFDPAFLRLSNRIFALYQELGRQVDPPIFALVCRVAWSSVMMMSDKLTLDERIAQVVEQQEATVRIIGADPNFWSIAGRVRSPLPTDTVDGAPMTMAVGDRGISSRNAVKPPKDDDNHS